jgi:cyclase
MKKKRIIPLVLFRDGYVIQARNFGNHKRLGLLGPTLTRLEEWGADEIILVNISSERPDAATQLGRTDIADEYQFDFYSAVKQHAIRSSVPLTVGGGILGVKQAARYFEIGADKVLINTGFHVDKNLVPHLSREFGNQAVVLGVDYVEINGSRKVFSHLGKVPTGRTLSEVAQNAEEDGVGEFFLNSINRDGAKQGLDLQVVNDICELRTPLIICGGVGEARHISEALRVDRVDGVAAANYFQHIENSVQLARKSALSVGILVRRVM